MYMGIYVLPNKPSLIIYNPIKDPNILISRTTINETRKRKMENVMKMITGFFDGVGSVLMAVIPVSILWFVLTGGTVFGVDVIANLTTLVNDFGNGGFTGLIVLLVVMSFFVKK